MRFGPPEIRKCLSCSQLVAQHILWSGNTFGAKYWTDGKITAGMLPNIPDLGRCPHYQSLMWFSDGTEIEKNETASSALPSLDLPAGAKFILPPVKEDYLQALSDSFYSSKEQELNLRFGAWHAANDKFRIDDALGTIIANWFRKMVKLPPRKSVFDEKTVCGLREHGVSILSS